MRLPSTPLTCRIAGALAVAVTSAHSFNFTGVGPATLSSPYPIPWILLVLMGMPIPFLGFLVGALFFFATRSVSRGEGCAPRLGAVGLIVAAVASFVWFIGGWRYGLQYQGKPYVVSCLAISVAMLGLLSTLLILARRSPTWHYRLGFHFLLFGWLTTYAFPYLGELP
jgi:hypothetical protein